MIAICAKCQQPLTGNLEKVESLGKPPERTSPHAIAPSWVSLGTYVVNFDGSHLILHPDDVPGTAEHHDFRRMTGCCGPSGVDGPNLLCAGCGAEVGTKEADCWTHNFVALTAPAVVELPSPA